MVLFTSVKGKHTTTLPQSGKRKKNVHTKQPHRRKTKSDEKDVKKKPRWCFYKTRNHFKLVENLSKDLLPMFPVTDICAGAIHFSFYYVDDYSQLPFMTFPYFHLIIRLCQVNCAHETEMIIFPLFFRAATSYCNFYV